MRSLVEGLRFTVSSAIMVALSQQRGFKLRHKPIHPNSPVLNEESNEVFMLSLF